MMEAAAAGAKRVVGYEANGGFLLNSDLVAGGKKLRALPTRDAVIVMLGILLLAKQQRQNGFRTGGHPARAVHRERPAEKFRHRKKPRPLLARFNSGSAAADQAAVEKMFGGICGPVAGLNRTDGLRITFANEEIIHLRPSGNAPEFRCYAEAETRRARARNHRRRARHDQPLESLAPAAANPHAAVAVPTPVRANPDRARMRPRHPWPRIQTQRPRHSQTPGAHNHSDTGPGATVTTSDCTAGGGGGSSVTTGPASGPAVPDDKPPVVPRTPRTAARPRPTKRSLRWMTFSYSNH